MPKAVFAGCARSCAPFLDGVLANVEGLGATYDAFEVVIVENDSADDTRRRLRKFAATRPNVRLIEADGLDGPHPKRTDRIAAARNLYISALRETRYADCDDLVVLDFDDVNSKPIDPVAFQAARAWLWRKPERRAVFVNSAFFYYDIWALRHPTWSPDDCWARVRAAQGKMSTKQAVRRYVAARQIPIAATRPPIPVDSAFGGLGVYRRADVLEATYAGLDAEGEEICEHVAFNAAVRGADGAMAIYPPLRNRSATEHVMSALGGSRTFVLEQDGAQCSLLGPPEHPLQGLRAAHPLYGRRLPALADIVYKHAPSARFIDLDANIGESIALARLAGARMSAIAVESSLTYCKYLWANSQRSPALFRNTRLVWGNVGTPLAERAPRLQLARLAERREVSLLKTGIGGFEQGILAAEQEFLKTRQPVLWLEAHALSASEEEKWRLLLESLAEPWPNMILFDNSGVAVAGGATEKLARQAIDLMAHGRAQPECSDNRATHPHLAIALFPARFASVYDEFRKSIPELGG